MRSRRLVPVLAVVVVAGLAATGCAAQSAAVRVGDRTVSESELIAEMEAYGESESMLAASGQSISGELAGSYDQAFVSELVNQRVTFMLAEQVFADEGLELTDAHRRAAEQQLSQQMGPVFMSFPEDYRQAFVDDVARLETLSQELDAGRFETVLADAAASTEIEVSSRFGRWDAEQVAAVPPEGPASPPGDAPAGAGGDAPAAPAPPGPAPG